MTKQVTLTAPRLELISTRQARKRERREHQAWNHQYLPPGGIFV